MYPHSCWGSCSGTVLYEPYIVRGIRICIWLLAQQLHCAVLQINIHTVCGFFFFICLPFNLLSRGTNLAQAQTNQFTRQSNNTNIYIPVTAIWGNCAGIFQLLNWSVLELEKGSRGTHSKFTTNSNTVPTQLLHWYLHRSNSDAPLKLLNCYHIVPTQLLCWSTCMSTPRYQWSYIKEAVLLLLCRYQCSNQGV